jgi:hypothetical protein
LIVRVARMHFGFCMWLILFHYWSLGAVVVVIVSYVLRQIRRKSIFY